MTTVYYSQSFYSLVSFLPVSVESVVCNIHLFMCISLYTRTSERRSSRRDDLNRTDTPDIKLKGAINM